MEKRKYDVRVAGQPTCTYGVSEILWDLLVDGRLAAGPACVAWRLAQRGGAR